uniref:non-specific serine/threonine protein kinase n=1 Tax=Ditylenchus dipsaci TaxID=166011 RepID=A0A915DJ26_9BILA
MVFALSLGGKDLEAYTIRNEREAFSIFFQVALSLAIAEETLEFEHRDLHIGNVLIAQCRATETIKFIFNNDVINMKSCGATVSIIDFTNSRMQKDGTTIFLDLSKDEELFKGTGDYQFDIYRMMREKNRDAHQIVGAKKIALKRRKEILSKLDFLLQHDRIKTFLDEESVLEIFQDFRKFIDPNGEFKLNGYTRELTNIDPVLYASQVAIPKSAYFILIDSNPLILYLNSTYDHSLESS